MKMGTVRKVLAFTLAAGLMVPSMSVFAKEYEYYNPPTGTDPYESISDYNKGGIVLSGGNWDDYYGNYPPSEVDKGMHSSWGDMSSYDGSYDSVTWYYYEDGEWVTYEEDEETGDWVKVVYDGRFAPAGGSGSSSSKSDDGPAPLTNADVAAINRRAEADAVQREAEGEGFHQAGDMFTAREDSMSAGEFYNNVVTSTPGIENTVTVGQGGNLVVDGQVTHMAATIKKVTNRAYVDSIRAAQAGTVLNVVEVSYPVKVATVNFYMPGITGSENIAAYQYNNGAWTEVAVAEVRADHVTLNMTGNGVVAFIAK